MPCVAHVDWMYHCKVCVVCGGEGKVCVCSEGMRVCVGEVQCVGGERVYIVRTWQ